MRHMIDQHQESAQKVVRALVFSCGFDSSPCDLGVFMAQDEMTKRFGKPAPRVRGRVRKMKGTFSGGTAASFKATMAAAATQPGVIDLLKNAFLTHTRFRGPCNSLAGHQTQSDGRSDGRLGLRLSSWRPVDARKRAPLQLFV
jgi:short subunit dehydrogenase-like uncharacterized protein